MIGIRALIDALTSHAAASGYFASVIGFEPKSMPDNGPGPQLTYAVFLAGLGPARTGSGLSATTARVELTGRIFNPFRSMPEDAIHPDIVDACDALFSAYSGDFDLGGHARNIDLLGGQGQPLAARAGYQKIGDATFRVLDITIPIIVNDAWTQGA